MTIGAYRDLVAWQRAMTLVEMVYRATATFPDSERFGLTQQLRRAAISVPSNIAEGHVRRSRREYLRFVIVALSSLAEVETQLAIAERLGYIDGDALRPCQSMVDATARLLRGLEQTLSRPSATSP